MSEWQPIDSAPKDGTFIVVQFINAATGKLSELTVRWENGYNAWRKPDRWRYEWYTERGGMPLGDPTHWKPA